MQKTVFVEAIGEDVIISRRKGTRNMRLSIRSDGRIRLNIPHKVNDNMAYKFLIEKSEWIKKHQKQSIVLRDGDRIGKSHILRFESTEGDNIRTRLSGNEIIIRLPGSVNPSTAEAQKKIKQACDKALLKEASNLLPQRLEVLSKKYDIPYKSCKVKKLKSRWGSCDTNNDIILNSYLIQLSWPLIDYVILHELTHTQHRHHQPDFWQALEAVLPDYKQRRKEIKQKATEISATTF